jgi:Anthrone oxygenase
MDWLVFTTLVVSGFMSCAEFGSFAFVHPILRRLPPRHHIEVEQGLLLTFGRVMPVLMTLTPLLVLSFTLRIAQSGPTNTAAWASVYCFACALVITIWLNVPINRITKTWDLDRLPDDWKQVRTRWEVAQGIRATLQLAGFILFCYAVAAQAA